MNLGEETLGKYDSTSLVALKKSLLTIDNIFCLIKRGKVSAIGNELLLPR